jgi:hypothetical protein
LRRLGKRPACILGLLMARPLAIVILLAVAHMAHAQPRVAVVPFEGDRGSEVQDIVAELLERDYPVSSPTQVSRTLDKLGFELEMSDKQLRKLSNELDVDVIVRGSLGQSGKYRLLTVRLFVKGKKARGFKAEFGSIKSRKVQGALRDKLVERIGGKGKKQAPAPEPDEDDDPPPRKKKSAKDDPPPRKKKPAEDEPPPRKKRPAEDDDDDLDDDTVADDDPDAKPAKRGKRTARRAAAGEDDEDIDDDDLKVTAGVRANAHTANRAAVRADFGPSVSTRTLRFTSRNFEQAPRPYANSPVPGGRVEASVFPLAFGNPDSFVAGLGIGGSFDQTMGLTLQSTLQPGTKFPVLQRSWSAGLRMRIAFGKKPTSPTMTLSGGVVRRTFVVDRSQLQPGNIIDLPDVDYRGFNPGLEFRIPIIPAVALLFGGEAVLVTSTGAIQSAEQYGQAKVTGGSGVVGIDIMVASRIAVRLIGEATQMGFAFVGNGEMSNNRDGNPMTKDVGGASDRYLGGAVTLGVLY